MTGEDGRFFVSHDAGAALGCWIVQLRPPLIQANRDQAATLSIAIIFIETSEHVLFLKPPCEFFVMFCLWDNDLSPDKANSGRVKLARLATCHRHRLSQLFVDDTRLLLGASLERDFCRTDPAILGTEVDALLFIMLEGRNGARVKRMVANPDDGTLRLNLFPASIGRVFKSMECDSLRGCEACIQSK